MVNDMAKPIKRGGKWQIQWFETLPDGTRKRRSATFTTHQEAVQHAARCAIEEGPLVRGSELLRRYRGERVATHRKRTQATDESVLRTVVEPLIAHRSLASITQSDVDAWTAQIIARGLAPYTSTTYLATLRAVLRYGARIGLVHQRFHFNMPKTTQTRLEHFSQADVDAILQASRLEGLWLEAIYATAFRTGLRLGELAALEWNDVDLENRLITVSKSHDGATKTGNVRYVPIVNSLLPILERWSRQPRPLHRVFHSVKGRALNDESACFKRLWRATLEDAGVKFLTFHSTRHTFASLWMVGGGDPFRLQKMLGHSNPKMTMRYTHLSPKEFASDWARL